MKIVDIIHIKPIKSKKPKDTPKNNIAQIVAATGSIQGIVLAFVGHIMLTPVK